MGNGSTGGDDPVVIGLYFVIDTRGANAFDNQPHDGDEQSGQLVVTEANEENVTATDSETTAPTTEEATDENENTEEEPTTQEADNGEEFDPEDNGDQDEDTTTPFFGIGTRETFGGTVLIGSTYLLGHWV